MRRALMRPGTKVTLSFVRDGEQKQVTLTLRRLL
jgi:S1-C subfamily serine protease